LKHIIKLANKMMHHHAIYNVITWHISSICNKNIRPT
jgi:hypothetical protein